MSPFWKKGHMHNGASPVCICKLLSVKGWYLSAGGFLECDTVQCCRHTPMFQCNLSPLCTEKNRRSSVEESGTDSGRGKMTSGDQVSGFIQSFRPGLLSPCSCSSFFPDLAYTCIQRTEATGCFKMLVTIEDRRQQVVFKKYLAWSRFCDKIKHGTMATKIYTQKQLKMILALWLIIWQARCAVHSDWM
jgi:hypothetical protein